MQKPMSEFALDRHKPDGHLNQCKSCRNASSSRRYKEKKLDILKKKTAYRARNRHLARAHTSAWSKANPEARAASRHAYRARKLGAPGRYTAQDVQDLKRLQRGRCAICSGSLAGGHHIDHRTPLFLGGTNDKTNLQLLCPPCNLSKAAKDPIEHAQEIGRLL